MTGKLDISESFISRIWDGGREYYRNLQTVDDLDVEVISLGLRNFDSGPDYKDAKFKIGGKTYSGDVEIHRDFKGWHEHSHKNDPAFNSVILQVVLWDSEERKSPELRKKRHIPTVVLSNFLTDSIHNIWQDVISKPSSRFTIPCFEHNNSVEKDQLISAFRDLSMERLDVKSSRIGERLAELTRSAGTRLSGIRSAAIWKQALYEFIFEALGYSKNKEPMMKLARNLPIGKFRGIVKTNNLILVQAYLFILSGLLYDLKRKDEYIAEIKSVVERFSKRINVQRMAKAEWRFFRMRPQNFPTIRLAYGSQVIRKILKEDLLRKIVVLFKNKKFAVQKSYKHLIEVFEASPDNYWSHHYDFGKSSKTRFKLIGRERIDDIIINVVIPFVYHYARMFDDKMILENVLGFYRGLKINPANSVIKLMAAQLLKSSGVQIKTPAAEQAAIQLYNFYCLRERCKECKIGERLFREKAFEYRIIFY